MRFVVFAAVLIALSGAAALVRADDAFTRNSIPRKWLEPVLPEDLPDLQYPAYYNELEKAELEAFTGRYKRSLQTLMKLPPDADPVRVAMVKGTSLAAMGKREEALAALSQAAVEKDPRVQIRRVVILSELGRTDNALALVKEHLDQHPNSLAGHYQLGRLHEKVGDIDAAKNDYGWFVVEPQNFLEKWEKGKEKTFENAEETTILGRALDRWATLTGSYQTLPQLHDSLLNIFVRTYDVIDRSYWPAHVAAAEYCLSHDDNSKAVDELTAAANANPNDADVCDLLGKIAVEQWNFDAAESMTDALRKVDKTSIQADLLECRNLLQQRRPADAEVPARRVLAQQPNHIEALGLLAATYALRVQDEQTNDVLKQVEKIDPHNASAYLEVATQLGAMRQYPRAIAKYKVAIERAPWWTEARNGLGLLYTQSGDEEEAKSTLDAAHDLDPYNLRTTNYLRLLDQLAKLTRKETEHFVIMYDAKLDPLIPEYYADYLESIHSQVTGIFKTEPPVKTYIEVFPTHDAFSVRTTGSPWIGTVGASTGRVIAMVAPRKGDATLGPFHWAQVLRHEYTHTVTLAATDNRIPHWMTEGLAVYEEHSPLKWEWIPMLYNAVTKDQLFTMENLTWGFVRPKKPTDRSLAYAESYWICSYVERNFGHDAILKMLAEVKTGASEKEMFQRVLNKSLPQFQLEFFSWAREEVSKWGYDEQTSKKYDQLRELGEAQIKAAKFADAAKTWEEIVKLRPVDALPHTRLAGLYLTKELNDPAKAIEHLKVLHAVELKDNRYAKRIARLYRDMNQLADAKEYAMQAVYIDPYDLDAHTVMLEVAEKSSDQTLIDREKRVIPILEKWIDANRPKPLPG